MNVGKINKKTQKKRILVAPLDWGLGHATRCIPLINLLIKYGAEPVLAAEGHIASLLQSEFPGIPVIKLKGYEIRYSSSKKFFFLKMLTQTPSVIKAIRREKSWLNHIIQGFEIDAVISDNRFGLYSNKIPCVFITHQLAIQTGNEFLNQLSQKINYGYINRFCECWVPDIADADNLAGKLSRPEKLPSVPVKYLGILTRFEKEEMQKEIDLLIMISGPEPQRSIFEKLLLDQIKDFNGKVVFVRGLPAAVAHIETVNNNLTIHNHLPANELNTLIQSSKIIIARSGYSTIMDLVALNQKAILIPTPGQTEQEWLAAHLLEKKFFYTTSQENFLLKKEIENFNRFEFSDPKIETTINENVVIDWLNKI